MGCGLIHSWITLFCASRSVCCSCHLQRTTMPKETRTRSGSSQQRSLVSPFPSGHQKHSRKPPPPDSSSSPTKDMKEWEEICCPVCMEHPHNAVLLLCSSHDKGCRPFMCDTSYRHSNCLDQFRKALSGSHPPQDNGEAQEPTKLLCPMCRGQVTGWTVVEAARQYMNTKSRSCSLETCGFSGGYRELRKHARTVHPLVHPTDADPEREHDWRRMEQQRAIGDLIGTLLSAIGGEGRRSRVGGYIGEDEEELESGLYPTRTVLVYVRVNTSELTTTERPSVRSSRAQARSSSRRLRTGIYLWEETSSEPESTGRLSSDDGDDDNNDRDGMSESAASRRGQGNSRRRLRMLDEDEEL